MYCASNKTAKIKIKNNTHSLRIFVREERRLYAGWVEVRKQRRCSSSRSSEIRRKITEAGFPAEWRRSPASTEIDVAPAEAE